jgi:hypothetical protein
MYLGVWFVLGYDLKAKQIRGGIWKVFIMLNMLFPEVANWVNWGW